MGRGHSIDRRRRADYLEKVCDSEKGFVEVIAGQVKAFSPAHHILVRSRPTGVVKDWPRATHWVQMTHDDL